MSVGGIQGGGSPPVLSSATPADGAPAVTGTQPPDRLEPGQIQSILREIRLLSTGGGESPAPAGAPALPPPEEHFSAEDAALILGSLHSKLTESQLKNAADGVKVDAQKKKELHQEAVQRLQDAAAKANESKIAGIVVRALGIAAKIAGVVGGAALLVTGIAVTAGTAGIATVAGVAMMCLGGAIMGACALDLVMDVAGCISMAFGGPDLSLMALASKAVEEILKACGVPEEYAPLAGTLITAAVQVAVALAVGAACLALVPFTAGAGLAGTAAAIAFAGSVLSTSSSAFSGVISIATGGAGIWKSAASYQADSARADKLDFDRMITKLQEVILAEQDRIEDLVKGLEEAMSRISSMISSAGNTRMEIARRMV